MTATTYTNVPRTRQASESGGWFSNLLERMVEAQAARVRKEVYTQLRGYNDATLTELGFTPANIALLRKGEFVGFPGQ